MPEARLDDGSVTSRRGAAMVLLCGIQLLLLLDFSIVNLAMPDMRHSLGFTGWPRSRAGGRRPRRCWW